MATASFHRFPDLPAELRLQIWELVACTAAQPRIHFMPIDEYTPEEFGRRLKPGGFDLYGSDQPHDVEIMPRTERSWVKDNESAYLIDTGMWTACKESASVLMEKRRKSQNTEFATFRDGGYDSVFDVDIHRDLFCFQLTNDADWNSGWDELPFWRTTITLRNGADNIAVEFDSSWAVGVQPGMTADALNAMQCEPGPRGFFLSILAAWREDSHSDEPLIYLIDRSIHRRWSKPDNPACGSFDEIFKTEHCSC
ncbi:hypothetical protein CcaCcLH18_10578 [Colletotrichum camelliae]|nr:hypothetical protein CcaCcLH18_10578 [Colletotrichum camelliae]